MSPVRAGSSLRFATMRRCLLALFVASLFLVAPAAGPAAAYPSDSVALTGHGFGHGRGMGQFGALGYALNGTAYTDILSHFYGGTTAGTIGNTTITVELMANVGLDTIVQQEKGHLALGPGQGTITPGNNAVLVHRNPTGLFTVQQAANCGGPWQTIMDNV